MLRAVIAWNSLKKLRSCIIIVHGTVEKLFSDCREVGASVDEEKLAWGLNITGHKGIV